MALGRGALITLPMQPLRWVEPGGGDEGLPLLMHCDEKWQPRQRQGPRVGAVWGAWEGASEGEGRSSSDENKRVEVRTMTGYCVEGGG